MGTLSVSGQTQGGIPGVLVLSHPLWNLEEDPPQPLFNKPPGPEHSVSLSCEIKFSDWGPREVSRPVPTGRPGCCVWSLCPAVMEAFGGHERSRPVVACGD